jgi:hypothetical protein
MNWNDIQLLDRVVTTLNKLGYKINTAKYGQGSIGVYPLEDKNPLYSRDAEVYTGTIEQIACWMRGVEHQDGYLKMLKATSDERIKALEEKYIKKKVQQGLLDKIKNPDIKVNKHTQDLIDLQSK